MHFTLALTSAGDVVRGLHPHERVHLDGERLLDAQGHVAGEVRLAVQQGGQRGPGNTEHFRGGRDGKPQRCDDLGPDKIAWMRRVQHTHCFLLVVILKVDVANLFFSGVDPEGEPPVLCDVKAPTSFPTAAEKMGFPYGDAAQFVHFFHALQKSQHLAELVHDTCGKPLRAVLPCKGA